MLNSEKECPQCGNKHKRRGKYCRRQCCIDYHNRNRILKPNLVFDCKVCGKHVEKWVAPSRLKNGADTGEYCSRKCAGVGRRGENHFNWKGGRRQDKDGYVLVYRPDHPNCNNNGLVREHRLVMENSIGRHLSADEVVHHINGDTSDNRIENLQLYPSNKEHKTEDYAEREIDKLGRFLPKETK